LTNLLSTAENVVSYHEPDPQMCEEYNDLVIRYGYEKTYKDRCVKANAIKTLLKTLPKETIYAETNHMFIKTFFDVIMHEFASKDYEINVIVLRRFLPAVLKSRVELGHFRDKTVHGINRHISRNSTGWLHTTNANTSILKPLCPDNKQDQYDLLIGIPPLLLSSFSLGYLFDIEARTEKFKRAYPNCLCIETDLEILNTTHGVMVLSY
jgi:hypothetical protein